MKYLNCKYNFYLAALIILIGLLRSGGASSACHFNSDGGRYLDSANLTSWNIPSTVTLTGSETVGQVIWSSGNLRSSSGRQGWIRCGPGPRLPGNVESSMYFGYTQPLTSSVLGGGIYETSLPGIGLRINVATFDWAYAGGSGGQGSVSSPRGWFSYSPSPIRLSDAFYTVQFIKISTNVLSGVLTVPSFELTADDGFLVERFLFNGSSASSITVNARQPGCVLSSTSNYSVHLGDINANRFASVGSAYGDQTINLDLDCKKDTYAALSLTATAVSGLSNDGVVETTGTATGVGVQVLSNGTPLALNVSPKQMFYMSSAGTTAIPITVRYYRTGTMTGGSANAVINYTINYL